MLTLGILAIMITILGIAIVVKKSYNVEAEIYERVGSGMKLYIKKARRVEGLAGNKLKFFASKIVMSLPASNFFYISGKNNFKIKLYKDEAGNLHPIGLRFDESTKPHLVPHESDVRWFHTVMHKENMENYKTQSDWEKYAPLIIVGSSLAFAAFALILTFYYYGQYMQGMQSQLVGSMSSLTDALHTIGSGTSHGTVIP